MATKAREFLDLKVNFISLLFSPDTPANMEPVIVRAKDFDPSQATFRRQVKIERIDKLKHLVYAVVYAPKRVDTESTWSNEERIDKALETFMGEGRLAYVDEGHDYTVGRHGFIRECFIIQKTDTRFPGRGGGWGVCIKVTNPATWSRVEKGECTGISLAGLANLGPEQEVEFSASDGSGGAGTVDRGRLSDQQERDWIFELCCDLERCIHNIYEDATVTDKQGAIVEVVKEFAGKINQIGSTDGAVENVRRTASLLTKVLRTSTGVEGGGTMTEADLQAMQGQVAGFGSRLDKVDAFITAQTAAAPALAAKETALTEKLSTIEAAGVALKTSVDQVLAQIGGLTALKADLDAAKTELAGAKTELAATKTELAAVSGTVTAIQKARPQGQAEGDPPAPGGAAPAAGTPAPATRKFKGVFGMRL